MSAIATGVPCGSTFATSVPLAASRTSIGISAEASGAPFAPIFAVCK